MEQLRIVIKQCVSPVKQRIYKIHKVKRGYSMLFASFDAIPGAPAMKVEHMFVTINDAHPWTSDRRLSSEVLGNGCICNGFGAKECDKGPLFLDRTIDVDSGTSGCALRCDGYKFVLSGEGGGGD
ncbi:hypothetical protein PR048_005369 [Dryococelus australis]|uniref:Uncharacterized protein n=1 Tax=Dryococelus australis TaxID=614101 RepID=A0ABQ9I828_9NEOP|nr:hypothetical protein PR048_005369 [Dryococelus australis]